MTRSTVGFDATLKCFPRLLRHPRIGARLAALQVEKELFGLMRPFARNGHGGRIRQLSLRITDLCNMRCKTCGQWGQRGYLHDKSMKELRSNEVTPSRYAEVFEDLVNSGHRPTVYFWGGEPMLYDGILDLVDKASQLGLATAIATNGTGIAAAAPRLFDAGMFLLQISIDGHSAELHDSIRPSISGSGSFLAVEEALAETDHIRQSKGKDLPLIASLTTISKENINNLTDIYNRFKAQVDMFVFYLSWWIDDEHATAHDADFLRRFGEEPARHRGWIGQWKPDDYAMLTRQLNELRAKSRSLRDPPVLIMPNIKAEADLKAYYTDHSCKFGYDQCVSIFHVAEVNSNGDVSPCRDYHDFVVGNIKDNAMTELWNSPRYCEFRSSLVRDGLMPVCTRCCGLMGY